ncbi:MAG: two-component system response regulator [Phycisphaeraceae bacterium]|nr:two-component system response regulator [Phycisphaeraceae bacterium]
MRVLVVDDEEMAREMLSNALSASGYEVTTASNGAEAWELLQRVPFRIVISDWEMPEMTGPELCREVRGSETLGYVYFVLVTSRNRTEDLVTGLEAGADDFICKPFEPSELTARIRSGERIVSLETRDLTIFAMAKLAESRDTDTGAHLERVRQYSRTLARQLFDTGQFKSELNPSFCHLIYLTSPLHDIGKVAIPDFVLLKPGRLSDREFEIMKTHAATGAETLEAALHEHPGVAFLQMARDIAASHHERVDGGGYPGGLTGDDIPLCGRIVAVADVYDALTSKRAYKDAFTHDVAVGIINDESGTHFDTRLVDAMKEVLDEFNEIRRLYQDESGAIAA